MKAIIVTCFESNEERAFLLKGALIKQKMDVDVITTDFSHIRKEKRTDVPNGCFLVETNKYDNNMSIQRIISHIKFSKDAFNIIKKEEVDLLWIMVPCLSLIKQANIYKKKHPNTKIIIDVIDMWPESLPIGKIKNSFPFKLWRKIRENNINCADELVSECDLYCETLKKEYKGNITTIYWARNKIAKSYKLRLPKDRLSLCYIGSINNIIDIELIKKIVLYTNTDVDLHIIGFGEKKDYMIETLSNFCRVIYHGPIYDDIEKQKIFSMCHAGLNIYKDDLYIGLTVKCIDYFNYGLPIINNINGDTWNFVEKKKVGVNINRQYCFFDINSIIEKRKNNDMIINLFNSNFSKEVFEKKVVDVVEKVI